MKIKEKTIGIGQTKIKCQHCKYIWQTRSKRIFVSCPNCLRKTKKDDN